MKENSKIREKVGHQNPFDVPHGYFDQLTDQIMTNLPEKNDPKMTIKQISFWLKIRPWAYMVALFVGATLIIRVALVNHKSSQTTEVSYACEEVIADEYLDISLEKAQLDNYSLYVYLENEDYNK